MAELRALLPLDRLHLRPMELRRGWEVTGGRGIAAKSVAILMGRSAVRPLILPKATQSGDAEETLTSDADVTPTSTTAHAEHNLR